MAFGVTAVHKPWVIISSEFTVIHVALPVVISLHRPIDSQVALLIKRLGFTPITS